MVLALLAALLAVLAARSSRRLLLAVSLTFLLLFVALATPLGANFLVRMVEASRPSGVAGLNESCPDERILVFLSGGMRRPARSPRDYGALTTETIDRVLAFRADPIPDDLTIVVSGGGPFAIAEATIIAGMMQSLGVDSSNMVLEIDSVSTRTSALEVARMIPPEQRSVVLATSALHLPRAAWTFRRAGIAVCPWPLNSRHLDVRFPAGLWPRSSALEKSEWALYELAGQLYYRLAIRRDSLNGFTPARRHSGATYSRPSTSSAESADRTSYSTPPATR